MSQSEQKLKNKNLKNKTPEKALNKMKTSNWLDADFKTLFLWMLNDLTGRVNELSENFNNKEIGNIKMDTEHFSW